MTVFFGPLNKTVFHNSTVGWREAAASGLSIKISAATFLNSQLLFFPRDITRRHQTA
jgi:hypothetical protein